MAPPVAILRGLLPSRSIARTWTSLAPDAREVKMMRVPSGSTRGWFSTPGSLVSCLGWLPSLFAIQMSQLLCVVAL